MAELRSKTKEIFGLAREKADLPDGFMNGGISDRMFMLALVEAVCSELAGIRDSIDDVKIELSHSRD
jgi:hypothetical protein